MNQRSIAKLIERDVEKLTEMWMRQVREDERIASESRLAKRNLKEQGPHMIKEICQLLIARELPYAKGSVKAGMGLCLRRVHEYQGRDRLRELFLLRVVLFDHLTFICTSKQLDVTAED